MMGFNPYAVIAVLVAEAALLFGSFRFGVNFEAGQNARTEALVKKSQELGAQGAAEEIAKLKPVYKTYKVQAETITRENTVYKCVSDPTVERLLDAARAGGQPSEDTRGNAVPAGTGEGRAP